MKMMLASCAALAICAGAANAMTYASLESTGTLNYNGSDALTFTDDGNASLDITGDTSTPRDYVFSYNLAVAGGAYSFADSFDASFDYSIDNVESFLTGLYQEYSPTYVSVSSNPWALTLKNEAIDVLVDTLGFDGNLPGGGLQTNYTLTASLDAAPVPLPASLPLLLAGLGGFAAFRRRKQAA